MLDFRNKMEREYFDEIVEAFLLELAVLVHFYFFSFLDVSFKIHVLSVFWMEDGLLSFDFAL